MKLIPVRGIAVGMLLAQTCSGASMATRDDAGRGPATRATARNDVPKEGAGARGITLRRQVPELAAFETSVNPALEFTRRLTIADLDGFFRTHCGERPAEKLLWEALFTARGRLSVADALGDLLKVPLNRLIFTRGLRAAGGRCVDLADILDAYRTDERSLKELIGESDLLEVSAGIVCMRGRAATHPAGGILRRWYNRSRCTGDEGEKEFAKDLEDNRGHITSMLAQGITTREHANDFIQRLKGK